jgi:hypothetical protein
MEHPTMEEEVVAVLAVMGILLMVLKLEMAV